MKMSVLNKRRLLPTVIKSNIHIDFYQSQKVLKAKEVHCPKRMKREKNADYFSILKHTKTRKAS